MINRTLFTNNTPAERSQAARLRALAGHLALQIGLTKMTAPDATTHLRDLPMEVPPMLPTMDTKDKLHAMATFARIQAVVKFNFDQLVEYATHETREMVRLIATDRIPQVIERITQVRAVLAASPYADVADILEFRTNLEQLAIKYSAPNFDSKKYFGEYLARVTGTDKPCGP